MMGVVTVVVVALSLSLAGLPRLMRAYSTMCAQATVAEAWDAPARLSAGPVDELRDIVCVLLRNDEHRVVEIAPPSTDAAHYDAVVFVDASAFGFGAFVAARGSPLIRLSAGWNAPMRHSAHAEPRAAAAVLRWMRDNLSARSVAVVTDHQPMASAQRHWRTANGGWSSSWPLNDFMRELYEGADGARRDVFHIAGVDNIADGPSRSVALCAPLDVRHVDDFVLPGLAACWHPFAGEEPRPSFFV